MYHCKICHGLSPPRQPLLRHVIKRIVLDGNRRRSEIEAELPVCAACKRDLDIGFSLSTVIDMHRPKAEPKAPIPVPQPPPKPVVPVAALAPLARPITFGKRS